MAVQPLPGQVAIADEAGKPTAFFQKAWAAIRGQFANVDAAVAATASLPPSAVLADGACLVATGAVTVSAGSAGQRRFVYNDSGAGITLTQGAGVTLRLSGTATTGNRTLAQRGRCELWWRSETEVVAIGEDVT